MARHDAGRATLRTRADGATELRVNGVFVMDDAETSTERLLARRAVERLDGAGDLLVGGLGLGCTVRELLSHRGAGRVVVAEIEPAIPAWMADGTLPGADLLADPRVDLRVGDVRDVVAAMPPESLDAILLDVDNGPDFLVLDANARVYEAPFVRACASRLRAGGELFVWSQADSAPLRTALAASFHDDATEQVPVSLQGRDETYWLLRGRRPRTGR